MAINRATRYPGRWEEPTPGQSEGAFKNKSGDLAVDGSYIEKDWANDWAAFFSSILNGEPANGTVDAVGASQLFDRLIDLIVPIDTVIYRHDNTDPESIYPGTTWEATAQGRFVVGVGEHTDVNGDPATAPLGNVVEGTYSHTLTDDEMPQHSHGSPWRLETRLRQGTGSTANYMIRASGPEHMIDHGTVEGGGLKHNNIPPGYGLYAWRRIA